METAEARLIRLREERVAREKARIEKLRELNLNKYKKNEPQTLPGIRPSFSSASVHRPSTSDAAALSVQNLIKASKSVRNNFHVNGTSKRPITVPLKSHKPSICRNLNTKPKVVENVNVEGDNIVGNVRPIVEQASDNVDHGHHSKAGLENKSDNKDGNVRVEVEQASNNVDEAGPVKKPVNKNFVQANKLIQSRQSKSQELNKQKPITNVRKSMLPHSSNISIKKASEKSLQVNPNRQSVFERLYQPKVAPKKELKEVKKIQTDAKCLKRVTKNYAPALYKRHTCFEHQKVEMPVRRSISAVHFKRIKKSEINNCIHKWASVGEKLDKISLKDVNEDHSVKGDKVVSAVKSEKKRVQFQTPVPFSFNTPKREELQARLHSWLQKRGKSIDSYHHLQCFGIQHLSSKIEPLNLAESVKYDDENKENIPLDSDSDNESYNENMNEHANIEDQVKVVEADKNKWRHASIVSESADFNDSRDTTLTSVETPHPKAGTLLLGALNDLTELLRDGFDWEQCARWLRVIRSRFPSAPDSAAYWECRAALEERRGDLPNSIHCWEEAIAKGTERSVVEANLDQLLDKFMQLQISPSSDLRAQPGPKMIDVKNIFKSTIIRFAVQQAKLRQSTSGAGDPPRYTCTPVRRSARLSHARTPLQVCASVKQAALLADPVVFVPNRTLSGTP